MKVELYINNRLCDIASPESLGVYLRRQFIKPSEMNTKDGQMSYSITLPASDTNNDILGYVNREEVQGKFSRFYPARLYIGGVKVFDGQFMLVEIGRLKYEGNLVIVAKKPISDIFADKYMNQTGEWLIDFKSLDDITRLNNEPNPPCVFPFVLYNLIRRETEKGKVTDRDVIDDSAVFTIEDFPASVNCIQMLVKIFKESGYDLSGTALADERLNKLYVSYKNPNDYEMSFGVNNIGVNVKWSNLKDGHAESNVSRHPSGATIDIDGEKSIDIYSCNLFDISKENGTIDILSGSMHITSNDNPNNDNISIKVPKSGIYRVSIDANFDIDTNIDVVGGGNAGTNIPLISSAVSKYNYPRGTKYDTDKLAFELKVLRNNKSIGDVIHDNNFFRNNQNQDSDIDGSIYPREGAVNFIDPKQNKNILCGFAFGAHYVIPNTRNPADTSGRKANPMAITGGKSWSARLQDGFKDRAAISAVRSGGYIERQSGNFIPTNRFVVDIIPKIDDDVPENNDFLPMAIRNDSMSGKGQITQYVWLDKGDDISVVTSCHSSFYRSDDRETKPAWIYQHIDFTLRLEPFMSSDGWIRVNSDGSSTQQMDANDTPTMLKDKINLIDFLPSNIKVNDWIDNFCKAFNLLLTRIDDKKYELNVKNVRLITGVSNLIDLDNRANVYQSRNESLKLPYKYELGFTIDRNEQGFVESGNDGGGIFSTRSFEDKVINQTSIFSYNWFKQLYDSNRNPLIKVPVITDREIWEGELYEYEDKSKEQYLDKSQRFWYRSDEKFNVTLGIGRTAKQIEAMIVKGELDDIRRMVLNYDNTPFSITNNYFLLLANSENSYTIVDAHITPEEYQRLDTTLIKFNGDLYHVAEIDEYDPLMRKKAILKLIRRII